MISRTDGGNKRSHQTSSRNSFLSVRRLFGLTDLSNDWVPLKTAFSEHVTRWSRRYLARLPALLPLSY